MTTNPDLETRLTDVERRLDELQNAVEAGAAHALVVSDANRPAPEADAPHSSPAVASAARQGSGTDDDPLWVLTGIRERAEGNGAVYYAGAVEVAAGSVQWQIGLPTDALLAADWTSNAASFAALGHPVRLAILQSVLSGATSVAELSAGEGMGTTGQLYHHITQLTAHGWLAAAGRGRYAIPPERVVPLLAMIAATMR